MPAFIGAGNFKGNWNANTNSGSAADLAPPLSPLLASSGTTTAGYNVGTAALTASVGDYWQVTVAGSTNIDGETGWSLNDWCLYASASAKGFHWQRLSVTDTISAIIVGNSSESGLKNELLASASAKSGPSVGQFGEVLFCSSSDGAGNNKYFEGNSNFTFDPEVNILNLTGTLRINGAIQATQVHTNYVTSSVLFDSGDTKFGNSADDQHQFTGSVYCSLGLTASHGISGSYLMGDGSRLTGVTAGSTLGNPGYGNAATFRVPFFGAQAAGVYGLTGSGRFNFYSASHDLQVTGTVRATNFYAADKIFHEGDTNTFLHFTTDGVAIEAGGIRGFAQDTTSIEFNPDGENFSVSLRGAVNPNVFFSTSTSNNVGIRCAPSGSDQALVVSGSTLFGSASANTHEFTGSLVVSNGIYTTQDIIHWGDPNTKITFADDQIDFTAGAVTLLSLDESTQDSVIVGDGTDVDFQVKGLNDNHAIFVEGSSDKVGIGFSAPAEKLSVSGSTVFGRPSGENDTHMFSGSVYITDDLYVEDKIYGLNDTNTYIDFNTDDKISLAAGGVTMVELIEGGSDYVVINSANADVDFRVETANSSSTLWVDGATNNVGIRCAPSGTIQALTVSGSTLFGSASASTHEFIGSVTVSQNISFAGNLQNASDDDTYIDFQNDQIRLYAGNVQFADFDESGGQNITTLNGLGADIDFVIKSNGATGAGAGTNLTHTVFVEGSSGKVGIAESAPGAQLDVSGSTILGRHDGSTVSFHQISGTLALTGNVGINTATTGYSLTLPNSDDLVGRGLAYAWSTYSSARYKKDVITLSNPIDKAKKLRGVEFTWRDSGEKDFGFIAEEVGNVLPQLVSYEPDGKNAIGMDYSRITSLLVECVKYQQDQIEIQEKRIKTLEKKQNLK